MLQLQLLSLVRTEEELVAVEATGTAELLDVMARILITVFQAQEREKDERAIVYLRQSSESKFDRISKVSGFSTNWQSEFVRSVGKTLK